MLRSCYTTRMSFGTDPGVNARVRWYFCEPTAQELGFPTTFVSRNYVDKGIWPDVGEVEGLPRPWRDGSFPVVVPGTHGPCGRREIWDHGADVPNPPGLQRNDFGLPFCCEDQLNESGQPLFEIIPNVVLQQRQKHYFSAAIAFQGQTTQTFNAVVALTGSVTTGFLSQIGVAGEVHHALSAVIAGRVLLTHTFGSVIASVVDTAHSFVTTVAEQAGTSHTFNCHIGNIGSTAHTFSSLLCPQPGAFIETTGFGTWTAPPAIHAINVFAWGQGGQGNSYFSVYGGAGGGGGGFASYMSAPVHPGGSYSWYVNSTSTVTGSGVFHDLGETHATAGEGGTTLGGGAGGVGSGGTFNSHGGLGGTYGGFTTSAFGSGGAQAGGPMADGMDGENSVAVAAGNWSGPDYSFSSGSPGGSPTGTTLPLAGQWPGGGSGGQAYSVAGPGQVLTPGAGGLVVVTWNAAVHFFTSVLFREETKAHTFSSVVAAKLSATHTLKSTIATKVSGTHTLKSTLAAKVSGTHTLKSEIWNNLLLDYFAGTNQALSSHPMNLGSGWSVDNIIGTASNLAIASGNHVTQAVDNQFQQALADAGSANHTTEFVFQAGNGSGGIVDVVVRYQDVSNKVTCRVDWTAAKALTMYSVVAGVGTSIGSGTCPTLTTGVDYTLTVVTTASTVTMTISGAGITTTTVGPITHSTGATRTKFGFGIWRNDGANQFFVNGFKFRVY